MPQKRISPEIVTGVVTTTNNTQTTVCSITVPENSVVYVEAVVLGKDTSNRAVVAKQYTTATRTTGNTTVGTVAALITTVVDIANTGASVTIDASTNDIRVRVTGPTLAKQIEWQAELKVYIN